MDIFFASPEDMERIRQRHEMLLQDWRNRVRGFIDSLKPEDLIILRDLFDQIGNDPKIAAYYEGILAGTFIHKFPDMCESCGDAQNHGESPLKDSTPPLYSQPELNLKEHSSPAATLAEQFAEYGVEPLDGRLTATGKIRCTNCGSVYPNLKDRMLKEPGKAGCDGCIQKEKWG